MDQLILAWWKHAKVYYRKNGEPTSELGAQKQTLRILRETYGSLRVEEFGPLKLKAVREVMIQAGWVRSEINRKIGRIKRMFKWGAENELVSTATWQALQAVTGLRRGRSEAIESEPVKAISLEIIEATLPHLSPVIADMVQLQLLTGCRPSEICAMRPSEIVRDEQVWEYHPGSHKTEHHGKERVIFLGPEAQRILSAYLLRSAEAPCFSPKESEQARKTEMRENRKSPVQPSQQDRSKPDASRVPGDFYKVPAYRQAITRACEIAFEMPQELRRISSSLPNDVKRKLRE